LEVVALGMTKREIKTTETRINTDTCEVINAITDVEPRGFCINTKIISGFHLHEEHWHIFIAR
jgi:predicted transglutaminase-like protease